MNECLLQQVITLLLQVVHKLKSVTFEIRYYLAEKNKMFLLKNDSFYCYDDLVIITYLHYVLHLIFLI